MDGTAEASETTNIRRMVSEELKPSGVSNENRCGTSDQKNRLLDVEAIIDNSVTVQVGSSQSNATETDICKESKRGEGTGSSGKRQHTRWDKLPEKCKDGESVANDKSRKKRKTRWDNAENQMKLLGPLHLSDFTSNAVQETDTHDLTTELKNINKKLQGQSSSELIKRRHLVVSELIKRQPTLRTPPKFLKKIYVPVKQYPSYNFVGLILGPRGNTLKRMQSETGSRIFLRGLGSSSRGISHAFDNDSLHVRIEADNEESLDAAVKMVEKLMVPTDDRSNEHKQAQLKELASLKQSCKEVDMCYVCSEDQEHGCTCDSESNDTADRDEALLKRAHLFVEQLPKNIEDRHFREFFCPFGNLLETKVTRYGKNRKKRCSGYVKFENPNDAVEVALSLKGFKYKGMWICRVGGRLVFESAGVLPKTAQVPPETRGRALDFGIFINNLPESIDNIRLKELSSPFGRIVNARVIRDRKWRSKGCGIVEFEDHEDAAVALSHLNGFELERKVLRVVATRDEASSTGGSGSSFKSYSGGSSYGARFPGDPDCLGSQLFDFGSSLPPHFPEEGNDGPISWPTIYHPQ